MSFIGSTSEFKPYSFDEMLKPFLLKEEAKQEQLASLREITAGNAALSSILNPEYDANEINALKDYNSQIEDLSNRVYNGEPLGDIRRTALDLRAQYLPFQTAIQEGGRRRADAIAKFIQNKQDSPRYIGRKPTETSISEWVNGRTPNLYGVNGKDIYDFTKERISSQLNAVIEDYEANGFRVSETGTDPTTLYEVFDHLQKGVAFDNSTTDGQFKNEILGLVSSAIQDADNTFGLDNYLMTGDVNSINQFQTEIQNGILAGVKHKRSMHALPKGDKDGDDTDGSKFSNFSRFAPRIVNAEGSHFKEIDAIRAKVYNIDKDGKEKAIVIRDINNSTKAFDSKLELTQYVMGIAGEMSKYAPEVMSPQEDPTGTGLPKFGSKEQQDTYLKYKDYLKRLKSDYKKYILSENEYRDIMTTLKLDPNKPVTIEDIEIGFEGPDFMASRDVKQYPIFQYTSNSDDTNFSDLVTANIHIVDSNNVHETNFMGSTEGNPISRDEFNNIINKATKSAHPNEFMKEGFITLESLMREDPCFVLNANGKYYLVPIRGLGEGWYSLAEQIKKDINQAYQGKDIYSGENRSLIENKIIESFSRGEKSLEKGHKK